MSTFQKMKENMIQGQFLPGLIKDKNLLKVFNEVEREKYLPNEVKHLAYSEIDIKVSDQRYLISPYCLAKIIEKSDIKSKDAVLLVGSNYGYESAIISRISSAVMALEENTKFHKQAEINIKKNLIDNVVNINGSFSDGCKKLSPFDIIIFLGSVNKASEIILNSTFQQWKS
jgi:Protein-L-isoaspartate carboxylmethyltransferase